MFCLSDVFTSTQGTFEDSIEKHQGSVNALSNSWNFILRRTETNAFQFESRFLILSNFSSLHYFKKIPFQIAKVGIWSTYFFHLLPTKHIDFNFLYLYSYGRFLSHLNRKQILLTHWNIGWLWRRMHRLEDADPSIVALFFLQDIGMEIQHYKMVLLGLAHGLLSKGPNQKCCVETSLVGPDLLSVLGFKT